VRIGRRLRGLGAVALKNSVYVFPAAEAARRELPALVREITRHGGEAAACEASFVAGLSDEAIEGLFRRERTREYASVGAAAQRLGAGWKRAIRDEARARALGRTIERLKQRLQDIVARDAFGAPGREAASGALALLEDRLQGVESGRGAPPPPQPPRAATWVTRTGVMVDRIASAWLIRRFIDPAARFKFVPARGYRPMRGELRFDMAAAEFAHRDGLCTFEVLLEQFGLRDAGLAPIAEMVHDLDLGDGRYGRPEAPGLDRMIVGIAIASPEDRERLERGATVFDSLYESFRKHRSPPAAEPSARAAGGPGAAFTKA
jgi:hypothetical protein